MGMPRPDEHYAERAAMREGRRRPSLVFPPLGLRLHPSAAMREGRRRPSLIPEGRCLGRAGMPQ